MVYVLADIHGCFKEFMSLLKLIKFNSQTDMLYILGDAIDRGEQSIECLNYIRKTKNMYLLMGNHEQMMLDYYDGIDNVSWFRNGGHKTRAQLMALPDAEREKILLYVRKRLYYKTIEVNGQRYFLSHAGLNVNVPFSCQDPRDLVWSREEFYEHKALPKHTVIFGHTPSIYLTGGRDCSIWVDTKYTDKICIDSGCVYGGALACLRLDDGEAFYVKSSHGAKSYKLENGVNMSVISAT